MKRTLHGWNEMKTVAWNGRSSPIFRGFARIGTSKRFPCSFFALPCRGWSIIHAHSIDDAAGQLSLKNWNVSRSQATVENLKSIFLLAKLAYPLQGSLIREIKERRRRIFDNVKKRRDVLDTLLWISLSDRLGSFVGSFSYNYECYTDEKMIRSSSVW